MDTFICGTCQETFHDINTFVTHKNECVSNEDTPASQEVQEVKQVIHVQLSDGQYQQIDSSGVTVEGSPEAMVTGQEQGESESQMCLVEVNSGEGDGGGSEIHLMPLDKIEALTQGGSTIISTKNGDIQVVVADSQPPPQPKKTGKRPGRPRKSKDAITKPKEKPKKEPPRPEIPELGDDGKLHCTRCKRAFGRERHYKTHKCISTTDYVDILQEGGLLSEEESEEEEEDKAEDKSYDFKARNTTRTRGRPPKNRKAAKEETTENEMKSPELITVDAPLIASDHNGTKVTIPQIREQDTQEQSDAQAADVNAEAEALMLNKPEHIPNIPVFSREEEKLAFEETLNVDLSMVDDMYKTHVIDQNVNEYAPPPASRTLSELSVYSCNNCDKVFKTVSHMRLHCLTHTDVKPFRCVRCDFTSNSKGNLYTHMRIHTGQFYRCTDNPACTFHTPNKAHLIEHIATHSKIRQKCALCKKDYNTVKSLVNHIRKYHTYKTGKEYLERFQGKHNKGNAILHQCHVCLRKFKKKIDRDRHLFIHNIKGIPNVHECDLCDYTATRRSLMEKHFTKHRVVYSCALCTTKFPSSGRLNAHLATNHKITDSSDRWVTVFQQCIAASLYLPEPDGSTDNLFDNSQEGQQAAEILEADSSGAMKEQDGNKVVVTEPIETGGEGATLTTNTENIDTGKNTGGDNEGALNQRDGLGEAGVEEEAEMTDEALALENAPNYNIYKRLNYVQMKMEVFHKLRLTFGTEECEYCGRLFYSKSDFAIHVRTHTGERPFGCGQCSYQSTTKDSLRRHVEKEHDKVTYVCQQCEYVASSRTQLWHHQQKHREPQEVECTLCSIKYPSVKRLRTHLSVQHPNLEQAEVKKMISACQKPQGKLGRRSHKCPFCPKTFMRGSADLQKHIWIHQGIKPFKCNLCPHACRSKNNLMSHMMRHSASKPFVCTDCNKAYKSKTALRWHIRTHKEGKIFRCVKCNYEAVQYSHLKRHMQTHDIVKRFVCQHCNYSANTLGYIKIHYTRHHKGCEYTENPVPAPQMTPGTKVYRCLSCDYLFGNLSDIKRHLKVRHHVSMEDITALENIESDHTTTTTLQPTQQIEQVQHIHGIEQEVTTIHPMEQVQELEQVEQTVEVPIIVDENGEQVPHSQSEVQVVEMMDQQVTEVPITTTTEEQDASTALQALQYSVPQTGMDERTASAVNILQHIIGMSKQGAFGGNQQITVQSEDGQSFVVNPDTIIVQQDSEEQELVISGDGQEGSGQQQYVIQYVTQTPGQDEVITEVPEVSGQEMVSGQENDVETTEVMTVEDGALTEQMDTLEVVELETPEITTEYEEGEENVRVVIPNNMNGVTVDLEPSQQTEVIEQIYTTVEGETTVEEAEISTEIITES